MLYVSLSDRDDLIEELSLLTEGEDLVSEDLDDALNTPDRPVLLTVPLDRQEATIDRLALLRDRFGQRKHPIVLLLPRGGAAMQRLRLRPFLASWLRGRIIDPDDLDTVDLAAERERFEARTGQSPEAFLHDWTRGALPEDMDHNLWRVQAQFLVDSEREE